MLRARRLLLSQRPLSEWRPIAAIARRASSRPQPPLDGKPAARGSNAEKQSKNKNLPSTTTSKRTGQDRLGQFDEKSARGIPRRVPGKPPTRFRKYVLDGKYVLGRTGPNGGQHKAQNRIGGQQSNNDVKNRVQTAVHRQATLSAEGKRALAPQRKKVPTYEQPAADDFVNIASPWPPTQSPPSSSLLRTDAAAWSGLTKQRDPSEARFAVLPSWIPPNSPTARWTKSVPKKEVIADPPRGLLNKPTMLKTEGKSQDKLSLATEESGSGSMPASGPPLQPKIGTKRKIKTMSQMSDRLQGGIFERLFPAEALKKAEAESQPEKTPTSSTEESSEDTVFVSLRNEIRNWIPEDERKEVTAPVPGEPGSHSTVIVLSGLSNSLVDTDFYRILPEAKHIEGWAGGLVKVVQARDPLSYEPIGRYFLMFHSHPAADAYKAEVLRLHALSQRLLDSTSGSGRLDDAPVDPQPLLTKDAQDAVRAFTICPPTAPLLVNVHMWTTSFVREMAKATNLAEVLQALRPDNPAPAKVLVTVNTFPGTKAVAGGGLTVDELWLTLRDDGRERGAPWVLSNLRDAIMPVQLTHEGSRHGKIDIHSETMHMPLEGPIFDEPEMLAELQLSSASSGAQAEPLAMRRVTHYQAYDSRARNEGKLGKEGLMATDKAPRELVDRDARFNRFILTFAQLSVSRRFVRSWHRRAIWDAHEHKSVSINAVALMSGS